MKGKIFYLIGAKVKYYHRNRLTDQNAVGDKDDLDRDDIEINSWAGIIFDDES